MRTNQSGVAEDRLRKSAGTLNRAKRRVRRGMIAAVCEPIENRLLLTSTLFVDFGDLFPVGGLTGTVGTLKTATSGVVGDPAVAGPNMDKDSNGDFSGAATDDEDAFTMTSFNSRYTTDGGNYTGGVAQLRADLMTLVRRAYQPFDIDVVELTATAINISGRMVAGAASLANISSTLGANEGEAKNNDGYVLVGRTIVHRPAGDGGDIDIGTVWGGYASVNDMPNGNNSDNTALGFLVPGSLGPGVSVGFWGNLIAHEAGHLFGFQHSLTTAPGGGVSPLIPTSEIMSYLGNNAFRFFSRYPIVRGNNNTTNNDDLMASSPPAPAGNRTPYDQWVNTASIGQNGAFHYITGTGANDIITITKNGGNADVSVQAFSDAAFTSALNVPGSAGASTTYSYSVVLDRPLLVDGGDLKDRFIIDADLGVTLTVRGMQGTDELVVMGKNASSATYTTGTNNTNGLDGNSDLRGSVTSGTTTINFQEFEAGSSVTIQDVDTLTVRTGGSDDDLDIDTPAAGQLRIDGTSDGVNIVPVTFTNVTNLTIDAGTNDSGDDDFVEFAADGPSTGLNTILVGGGLGNDKLQIDFDPGNVVPSGGLFYDGQGGSDDRLDLRGGSFTNETYTATGPGDGNIDLDGSIITFSDLDPVDDTAASVNFTFIGTVGVNVINVVNGPSVDFTATTQISSGNASFELVNFANKNNVTVSGGDGNDTINVLTPSLTTPGLSSLVLQGAADNDTINVRANANLALTVDGGTHTTGDRLNIDGETLAFSFTNTTLSTGTRQPVTYTNIETVGLSNGVFTASGVISANVVVDNLATLTGNATILGTMTALAGGTVAPGVAGPGTLIVGGAFFNAGSTYKIELNGLVPGTQHDQLIVNGTVSLGGATLDVTLGFNPLPGENLVIIRNDLGDPVIGTFAVGSLATFGGLKFAIDYAFEADADLNLNDVAMIRYGAALGPDPCTPGLTALFVSAGTGNDLIEFVPATGNKRIEVFINGVSEGVFEPSIHGILIGYGQAGNDTINVKVPSREVMLYGNVGNDTLNTGNNNGMLWGNLGNDRLIGGNQNDILIGGLGADTLEGGNADDVLIAGFTSYDGNTPANREAVCSMSHELNNGQGGWAGRISHLMNGGGENGTNVLDATTVFDDGDVDRLAGGNGHNWILANTAGGGVLDLVVADKQNVLTDI